MESALPVFQLEWLELPDEELAFHVLALWLGYLAESKGIPPNELSDDVATYFVEQTPNFISDNDPALELIFHVMAGGDLNRGGKLFRRYMIDNAVNMAALDEAVTGRRRQKDRAKKPRTNALGGLIEQIVRGNPGVTSAELLESLREVQGGNVIQEIDEDSIYWLGEDRSDQTTPISALKDRLSRAKKKIANA